MSLLNWNRCFSRRTPSLAPLSQSLIIRQLYLQNLPARRYA